MNISNVIPDDKTWINKNYYIYVGVTQIAFIIRGDIVKIKAQSNLWNI